MSKKTKISIAAVILGIILACGQLQLPAAVHAAEIGGSTKTAGSSEITDPEEAYTQVSYLAYDPAADSMKKVTAEQAVVIGENTDVWGSSNAETWYTALSDITVSGRVEIIGTVHLILPDACTVTVTGGICLQEGNTLQVHVLSDGDGTGTLIAGAEAKAVRCAHPGIGGNSGEEADGEDCGALIVHGGTVLAVGQNGIETGGNGIGGGNSAEGKGGIGGTVTVYSGVLKAIGGSGTSDNGTGGFDIETGGPDSETGGSDGGSSAGDQSNSGTSGSTSDAQTVTGEAIGGGKGKLADGAQTTESYRNAIVIKNDEGTVYGSAALKQNMTLESHAVLSIPEGTALTVAENAVLKNEGTIKVSGTLKGKISGGGTVLYGIKEIKTNCTAAEVEKGSEITFTAVVTDIGGNILVDTGNHSNEAAEQNKDTNVGSSTLSDQNKDTEAGSSTLANQNKDTDAGSSTLANQNKDTDAGSSISSDQKEDTGAGSSTSASQSKDTDTDSGTLSGLRVVWKVTGQHSAETVIDENGTLTVALGETAEKLIVSAAAKDPITGEEKKTEITVTVKKAHQTGFAITGKPDTAAYGDSFTLTAEGGNGGGAVKWQVEGESPATVEENTGKVTVTGVGEITIKAVKAEDDTYLEASDSYTFTSIKKKITPVLTGTAPKVYNGATDIPDTGKLAILLEGVLPEDAEQVSASAASYTYASAKAGEQKIIADGITLTGQRSGCYELTAVKAEAAIGQICYYDGTITPKFNGKELSSLCYIKDVTVTAAGYTISDSLDGKYAESYVISKEGKNSVTLYYKQKDTGYITDGKKYTVEIDKTAPVVEKPVLKTGGSLKNTEASFSFTVNEICNYYFVVQAESVKAPTAAELMKMTTDNNRIVGNGKVSKLNDGKATVTVTVSGLKEGTSYKVYVAAQDAVNNGTAGEHNTSAVAVSDAKKTPEEEHDDPHEHVYTEKEVIQPTCTEAGKRILACVCGEQITEEIPAAGHSMGGWKITKQPTCTEKGIKQRSCANCDYVETESLPANGHRYWDGVCRICGAKDPNAKEDTSEIKNTSEPTSEPTAITSEKTTTEAPTSEPASEPTDAPSDTSGQDDLFVKAIFSIIIVAILLICGLGVYLVYRNKRHDEE